MIYGLEIKVMFSMLKIAVKNAYQNLRQLTGEDAYERYLAHFYTHQADFHTDTEAIKPLSREAFFKQWQDNKWTGIKRCC